MRYKIVKPDECVHSAHPKDYCFYREDNLNKAFQERAGTTSSYRGESNKRGCNNCDMEVRIDQ